MNNSVRKLNRSAHCVNIKVEPIRIILLKINSFEAPHDALIASGHVGLAGYLYHPEPGTHNLNAPVGIQSLFFP